MAKQNGVTLEAAQKVIAKQREAVLKEMQDRSKACTEEMQAVLKKHNCQLEVQMRGGPTPEQGVFAVQAIPFVRALPERENKDAKS